MKNSQRDEATKKFTLDTIIQMIEASGGKREGLWRNPGKWEYHMSGRLF